MTSKLKTFVEAGNILGERIKSASCFGVSDRLAVLGILNGGVPVAMAIAGVLGVKCEALSAANFRFFSGRGRGTGAVAYTGQTHLDPTLRKLSTASEQYAKEVAFETSIASGRVIDKQEVFGKSPGVMGRECVIVDDGAASGATIVATVKAVLAEGAFQVLVALPTASTQAIAELEKLDCMVLCLDVRDTPVFEISAAYETWSEISDEVALAVLREQNAGMGMMSRLAAPLKK